MITEATLKDTKCYHCGAEIKQTTYTFDEKAFCCAGCESVYQVLSAGNLCDYYAYNSTPGQTQKINEQQYAFLEEEFIIKDLIDYRDNTITKITFYIPSIHCSSCIWLLEHLYKLNQGILHSRIDFLKKQVAVTFKHEEVSLKQVVELMVSVGYEPLISLQDVVKEKHSSVNRDLIKRIAVAGLCMGNVMLFSFPEYFGLSAFEYQYKTLFGYLNLAFAVPATLYCSREFFESAWSGLKNKLINLDAPLALIIAVLFIRTVFEVLTQTGAGFSDTLTGLIFLLLMGRWVKQRSYYHLSFERDYRSYFPVAVSVLKNGSEKVQAVAELNVNDRMLIHNNEITPADAILMKTEAFFDFSFVTGESEPVKKVAGEVVYAGGRLIGAAAELEVIKPVSQSYLTSLWNNETFSKKTIEENFNDTIAKYFSLVSFVIAFAAAGYWLYANDSSKAWAAFTAVLIVACPCVLSLSTPFTLSALLGVFDKNKFYLKNTDVVEKLAKVDTTVFDKTGTITGTSGISLTGELNELDKVYVASVAHNSLHPLSREIVKFLNPNTFLEVRNFEEKPGNGVAGFVNNTEIRLGSHAFVNTSGDYSVDSSVVYVEIDGTYKGYFTVGQQWREGLYGLFYGLRKLTDLHLLSGDTDQDKHTLYHIFPSPDQMLFQQSPHEKLEYIKDLQSQNKHVMMLGDGLNDAGALKQSDLGIAVTDNINNFSPACDAIIKGESMVKLPKFIRLAKKAMLTIKLSFVISASYNLIGVYFAIQGTLSPLTAAVLMPLSTITIITFTSVCTRYFSKQLKLRKA
ncbi:heavy metal translocating P-type ATPase [Desertivirga arenae]|uniref:heavy metal translocating P-type ATPase n=1 Tax=Desertivirga arenae TaxID=2810309 RepID=UPI001A96EE5F|nr:heavy metal translocating P-type ATPase metal-binding domain-containing protein [Pedobacter sp. SYSU D00823]